MKFRPCIDLHKGQVVQMVGGLLKDGEVEETAINFSTERSATDYAKIYRKDGLVGGHVIMLGPGNEVEAMAALEAFPGGFQVGGGIIPENAWAFLDRGASHVIVTSYLFREGQVDEQRLEEIVATVGREKLILDLSCRKHEEAYVVVTDRWQRFTNVEITLETLTWLGGFCDGFLIHGIDVEGKRTGIEETLIQLLGDWSPIPVTYAGGVKSLEDLDRVKILGKGRVDLTIGSALDIFGGDLLYRNIVAWQRRENLGNL